MFKRAERTQAKLKLAITGPSGSGKTYSALLIASGMGKKIALIDTENASASLYADLTQFDTVTLDPPYTIDKYEAAIKAAEDGGYDVLVIDSITHAWAGEGGLLAKKEALDSRGGNSYTNWGSITKEQEGFKASLLNSNVHLICTMRSKQDYILEQNDKGKSTPKKVGLAPIQRDGMEYEFTTVLDLAMDHNAKASKDRTGLFDTKIFKPSATTGKTLMAWLAGAKEPEKVAQKPLNIVPYTAPLKEPLPETIELKGEDEVFEIGKQMKGKKFSEMLHDKGFLEFVNDALSKNYAKSHEQLKRFHKYARENGAYK